MDDPGDQAISSSLVTGFGFAPIQMLNTAYHLAVQILVANNRKTTFCRCTVLGTGN